MNFLHFPNLEMMKLAKWKCQRAQTQKLLQATGQEGAAQQTTMAPLQPNHRKTWAHSPQHQQSLRGTRLILRSYQKVTQHPPGWCQRREPGLLTLPNGNKWPPLWCQCRPRGEPQLPPPCSEEHPLSLGSGCVREGSRERLSSTAVEMKTPHLGVNGG